MNITKTNDGVDPYRLPRNVIPIRYNLKMVPNLDTATFWGIVTVKLSVKTKTNTIMLNSKKLNIISIHINKKIENNFKIDFKTERLIITTRKMLKPGIVCLRIHFSGILNNDLTGFYRSTYLDNNGTEQVIATTQMQPSSCRCAFPCWDEPDLKAVFKIKLVVNNDLTVVSNSPEICRVPDPTDNNRVIVSFADTIIMSTYIVAFIVGRFETTRTINVNGTLMRILHVPGKSNLTNLALSVGEFSLKWFENYFDIKYPGKKIDHIAIPDFAAGAMENFGCVTYRETALLVDASNSTQSDQLRVVDVVSHENAHMWFGNLVTMKWWNGIWLNEAFATFIGVAACDAYKPEWDRWTLFAFERSIAFEIDSLQSTRSVEFPVKSPKEADAMFDVLTYKKGGSLLRMLEMFIGKDRFRNGLRKYLKKYSYKNTETNDLWDTIEKTLKNDRNGFIPVRNIMDSWIFQKGYPLISVKIDLENNIIFQQERFTFSKSNQADPTIWSIPIHFRDDNDGVEKKVLLNTREMRVKIANSSKPVVVNANGYGFYRVTYSAELFSRFDATTISNMKAIERYNLIDDAWNAVIADRVSAIEYLNFLDNFSNERDVAVWEVIVKNLNQCQRIIPNNKQHLLKSRIMNLTKPAFDSITWNSKSNEDNTTKKLRSILITLMAYNANDIETQQKAREIFNNAENGETIDAELLEAVTTIVSFSGGETEFNLFKNKFRIAETPQDKLTALYALANFQSEELIKNACEFALSNEVKTQDAPSFINRIIANRNYGGIAWNFVKERWNEIKQKYIVNGSTQITSLVGNIKLLNTPEQLADVKDFFIRNPIPIQEFKQKLDQITERQSVNVELRSREETRLVNALSS
jgi:puromycin-sensitive aminopeptidase